MHESCPLNPTLPDRTSQRSQYFGVGARIDVFGEMDNADLDDETSHRLNPVKVRVNKSNADAYHFECTSA